LEVRLLLFGKPCVRKDRVRRDAILVEFIELIFITGIAEEETHGEWES
jgi:hypothetical protein